MNRPKRSNYEPPSPRSAATGSHKDAKRAKLSRRRAQRKFASFCPASPLKNIEKQFSTEKPPIAEDFLEFLCVRHYTPALPPDLEIFTEPQSKKNELLHYDSEDELPLEVVRSYLLTESTDIQDAPVELVVPNSEQTAGTQQETAAATSTVEEKNSSREMNIPVKKDKLPVPILTVPPDLLKNEKLKKTINDVKSVSLKWSEMKDFYKCINSNSKIQKPVALLSFSGNNRGSGYVFDDLQCNVTTKHVHRLKNNFSASHVTLLSIKKQLDKESVSIPEIPKVGCCELDLPLLMDTVNSFGGVERVNSENYWRTVVDHLAVPKTLARRVKKIEDIYLKYILPYETLPKNDKTKLRNLVCRVLNEEEFWPSHQVDENASDVACFKKMAFSYYTMYCKDDTCWEESVTMFWDIVTKGERHACAVSGDFELSDDSQISEGSKLPWKLSELYSLEDSALQYLGEISKISIPTLHFEGVFSSSGWCIEQNGFHTISYHHQGNEIVWYTVPSDNKQLFLRIKSEFKNFVTPDELLLKGCPVNRCVQKEGNYVLIQPNCYYCTVATGYAVSEVVSIAPMNWFLSKRFVNYKPKLNEFTFTKMILNCAVDETQRETKSHFAQFLCQKLETMSKIIAANLKRLNSYGFVKATCPKSKMMKEVSQECSKCKSVCYLIRLRIKSKGMTVCIEDALKMINSKLKADEFVVELVMNVEKIQSIVKKLRTAQKT